MKATRATVIIMISLMVGLLLTGIGPFSPTASSRDREIIKQKIYQTFKQRLPAQYKRYAYASAVTVMQQSSIYKIDPMMITAVISGESSFNPETIGPVGEIGLMQLRPATGEWIANKMHVRWKGRTALKNPIYNIRLGVAYLGYLKHRYSPNGGLLYLAAYNMGETSLLRLLASKKMPNIYSTHIMKNYLAINE